MRTNDDLKEPFKEESIVVQGVYSKIRQYS